MKRSSGLGRESCLSPQKPQNGKKGLLRQKRQFFLVHLPEAEENRGEKYGAKTKKNPGMISAIIEDRQKRGGGCISPIGEPLRNVKSNNRSESKKGTSRRVGCTASKSASIGRQLKKGTSANLVLEKGNMIISGLGKRSAGQGQEWLDRRFKSDTRRKGNNIPGRNAKWRKRGRKSHLNERTYPIGGFIVGTGNKRRLCLKALKKYAQNNLALADESQKEK